MSTFVAGWAPVIVTAGISIGAAVVAVLTDRGMSSKHAPILAAIVAAGVYFPLMVLVMAIALGFSYYNPFVLAGLPFLAVPTVLISSAVATIAILIRNLGIRVVAR